jgi:asparagine N-glycosylation enzyme membrane subunit Stt3
MAQNPFDLFKDLAILQPGKGTPIDPAAEDAFEARGRRRRYAGLAWIPGLAIVLTLAAWAGSAVVGVALLVILLVGLVVYAERGDRVVALFRRPKG